jgi:hypothetical protein
MYTVSDLGQYVGWHWLKISPGGQAKTLNDQHRQLTLGVRKNLCYCLLVRNHRSRDCFLDKLLI